MTTADEIRKHLSGIKNTPRILKTLKSGTAKVKDWQGVVEVRAQSCGVPSRSAMIPQIQFAFHAAMIRDSLAELVRASHVDLLKKVGASLGTGGP